MAIRLLLVRGPREGAVPTHEELVSAAKALRTVAGWREAEAYASVGDRAHGVLSALCADEGAIVAAHSILDALTEDADGHRVPLELYKQVQFVYTDSVWAHTESGAVPDVIRGPHHDTGVRVVIQRAFTSDEAVARRIAADVASTRQEAGCTEYFWAQSLENPHHFLLSELWASQQRYDEHWALRLASGKAGKRVGGEAVERHSGADTVEFYRHQQFVLNHGHWLPANPERRSTTLRWPL